jgi:surfactin synthase thioesterase subunit
MLGGVPEEVFEDQDLFGFFEPILRADFQVAEADGLEHEPPVAAPLYALMGSEEENVDRISNWGRFTRSDFRSEVLAGNHFFIHKHPERMAAVLNACYNRVRSL